MDTGFHELHATVNCAIYFTYKYFSAYPGCVIGGGTWTGWTGWTAFTGICFACSRCVIRGEFGKNVELFVRVRGYGVCGGTH